MLSHKTGGFVPTCSAACAPSHETPSPEGFCFWERSHLWPLQDTQGFSLGFVSYGTAQMQHKTPAWCSLWYVHFPSVHDALLPTKKKKNKKEERGIKVTEKKLSWPSKASSFSFPTTGSIMIPPFNSVELISIGAPNFCYLKPFLPVIKLIAVPVPGTNITSC